MKQETCGAGGVFFSIGREKLIFRRIYFEICPNQILTIPGRFNSIRQLIC